jgi:hypothetical protein
MHDNGSHTHIPCLVNNCRRVQCSTREVLALAVCTSKQAPFTYPDPSVEVAGPAAPVLQGPVTNQL